MNIYHVTRKENESDYLPHWRSFICYADNAIDASIMHPDNDVFGWDGDRWFTHEGHLQYSPNDWVLPKDTRVKFIGKSARCEPGIELAHFNKG